MMSEEAAATGGDDGAGDGADVAEGGGEELAEPTAPADQCDNDAAPNVDNAALGVDAAETAPPADSTVKMPRGHFSDEFSDELGELHTCVFKPGKIGIAADWASGFVRSIVEGGQSDHLGVKPGWQFDAVEGKPYSPKLLDKYKNGEADYAITFKDGVRAVVDEINRLRANPALYAERMIPLQHYYNGHLLTYPGGTEVHTTEGVAALVECLEDLTEAHPVPLLTYSEALGRACRVHQRDMVTADFCGHIGTDGSTPEERLSRFGDHREQCGENVVFGPRTAEEVVWHMLIDDGSLDRGHRANLLNRDFHFVGAARGLHPSAESVAVVLLVDHLRVKSQTTFEMMRNVTEGVLGKSIRLDHAPAGEHSKITRKAWDRLVQEAKPDHLAVPGRLLDHVHRNDKPQLYREKVIRVPVIPVGMLAPKPGIDPAIVRSFVHRIDENHDDYIEETELLHLASRNKLNITKDLIKELFDEIVALRPWHERSRRSVSFLEIFAAIKAKKEWVEGVDVHVELENYEKYQLTFHPSELEQLCREVVEELSSRAELPAAPKVSDSTEKWAARVGTINNFLNALLTAEDKDTDELLQLQPRVQKLLGRALPGGASQPPRKFHRAVCMGQRKLWAHKLRPYRSTWLALHRAMGLHPLVPLPVHHPPSIQTEKSIPGHIAAHVEDQKRRNRAHVDGQGTGKITGSAQVDGSNLIAHTPGQLSAPAPWDEQRHKTEAAVNRCLIGGAGLSTATLGTDALESGTPAAAGFTFAAKQRFAEAHAKQGRASGWMRAKGDAKASSRSEGAFPMGPHTASGLGPANHAARSRGAGAFSHSAPTGVRGHFHNSLAVHEKDGSHGWPQSLQVEWDGAHIDHSRDAPQKNIHNFGQPAGYATMTPHERAAQWNTYFNAKSWGTGAAEGTHDSLALKCKLSTDQASHPGGYSDHKRYEYREDAPKRHGKFGRRDFDPQVREKPCRNPHNASQIEDKPMEEFKRQEEREYDTDNRAVHGSHKKEFKPHKPAAAMPHRHEDLANHAPMHCVMDGDQKLPSLGFFQNRHSDETDFKLYTRCLGSSCLDRILPLT